MGGGRKKGRKRKAGSTLEHKLLLHYLRDYKELILSHYEAVGATFGFPKSKPNHQTLTQDSGRSSQPITIDGVKLPPLDNPELLEQPYLSLPKELSGFHRSLVHDICTDIVHLFHCGVNGSNPGERFVVVSVYSDGLIRVPEIASGNSVSHDQCKPWIMKQNVDTKAETERQRKLIWELIDQPSRCLRDDCDTIDLKQTENLSTIPPPQSGDANCLLIDSTEKIQQCIQELNNQKPTELAFDLECYNRTKELQMTCLIQLATNDGRTYIIDVLAKGVWEKVNGLAPIFADTSIVKVGQGIRGLDIQSLQRDFGIFVHNVFDTYEAAGVLKLEGKGLATICTHYGLQTSELYQNLKTKYQATDWTKRPLSKPMVLYGRYDVHYLIQLRRLMTQDLVRLEKASNDIASTSLHDMISLMNQEDGIEDEDVDTNSHIAKEESETEAKTLFNAGDLRMIPGLMAVLSKSQEHCLKFWSCASESPMKNKRFVTLATQSRKDGKAFTKSQLRLYHELAAWREDVGNEQESLPGRICSLDFLARVAYHRPLTEDGLRKIQYFVPRFLIQNNKQYVENLFSMVKDSLKDDNAVVEEESFPSFEEFKKRLAKTEMMDLLSINENKKIISNPMFWAVSCATISLLIYGFLGDRKRRRSN
eukprot:CAMPEP_0116139374 /NCGR_PEP_ID=MMETSP0329-20121206/13281_1 /TAXON_ID=697910 /ORGANISM="Pseudo-nitzschia arenysensis, Strain B593" /LENGTH=647 /DNA_ID=CAMNT_0003634419 /DNA_START=115 /DNA_END=2058 /DNA_ORIENTATION=-